MGSRFFASFLPSLPVPVRQDTHRTLDVLSPQGETLDVLSLPYAIPGFGIRGLGSGNGGIGKSDKLWREALRGLPHFAVEARKHWSGWRPSIFSWCGRFPLDAKGYGAVGWVHRRMERWMKRKECCEFGRDQVCCVGWQGGAVEEWGVSSGV